MVVLVRFANGFEMPIFFRFTVKNTDCWLSKEGFHACVSNAFIVLPVRFKEVVRLERRLLLKTQNHENKHRTATA